MCGGYWVLLCVRRVTRCLSHTFSHFGRFSSVSNESFFFFHVITKFVQCYIIQFKAPWVTVYLIEVWFATPFLQSSVIDGQKQQDTQSYNVRTTTVRLYHRYLFVSVFFRYILHSLYSHYKLSPILCSFQFQMEQQLLWFGLRWFSVRWFGPKWFRKPISISFLFYFEALNVSEFFSFVCINTQVPIQQPWQLAIVCTIDYSPLCFFFWAIHCFNAYI